MLSPKYKTLVIEDEINIREGIIKLLTQTEQFEVIAEAGTVQDGIECIETHKQAHVIFMDVDLKGGYAYDILEHFTNQHCNIPPVVIITGLIAFENAQRLLNDFNSTVIQIIKKPFFHYWRDHGPRILEKLDNYYQQENTGAQAFQTNFLPTFNFIAIGYNRNFTQVNAMEITLITVSNQLGKSTFYLISGQEYPCNETITELTEHLPPFFQQINRAMIVNLYNVVSIDGANREISLRDGKVESITDSFYQDVRRKLSGRL